jgi:hypothetical protein
LPQLRVSPLLHASHELSNATRNQWMTGVQTGKMSFQEQIFAFRRFGFVFSG